VLIGNWRKKSSCDFSLIKAVPPKDEEETLFIWLLDEFLSNASADCCTDANEEEEGWEGSYEGNSA